MPGMSMMNQRPLNPYESPDVKSIRRSRFSRRVLGTALMLCSLIGIVRMFVTGAHIVEQETVTHNPPMTDGSGAIFWETTRTSYSLWLPILALGFVIGLLIWVLPIRQKPISSQNENAGGLD